MRPAGEMERRAKQKRKDGARRERQPGGAAVEDYLAWNYTKNGEFTVRSAYRMVMNTKHHRENWLEGSGGVSDLNTNSNEWTELWHIKVPSKLKVFL